MSRPSVCDVGIPRYSLHYFYDTGKLAEGLLYRVTENTTDLLEADHPEILGVGKEQDKDIGGILRLYKKLHVGFYLVPGFVTLNDLGCLL